jgi:hypothetical protein
MRPPQTRPAKPNPEGRAASQPGEPSRSNTTTPAAPQNEPLPPEGKQSVKNEVDAASIDSFPCSDPPGYYSSHC